MSKRGVQSYSYTPPYKESKWVFSVYAHANLEQSPVFTALSNTTINARMCLKMWLKTVYDDMFNCTAATATSYRQKQIYVNTR